MYYHEWMNIVNVVYKWRDEGLSSIYIIHLLWSLHTFYPFKITAEFLRGWRKWRWRSKARARELRQLHDGSLGQQSIYRCLFASLLVALLISTSAIEFWIRRYQFSNHSMQFPSIVPYSEFGSLNIFFSRMDDKRIVFFFGDSRAAGLLRAFLDWWCNGVEVQKLV